jgi:hypothetical protein
MPRGGARPGAGRPRSQPAYVLPLAEAAGLSPLEYMLSVIRDPKAETSRRDRLAMAAAPYCHPRIADRSIAMKEQRAAAAKKAAVNSEWEADLADFDLSKPVQ